VIYHFIYHVISINDISRDVFHDLPGPKAFRPLDWITSQVRWSNFQGETLREPMWNVTFMDTFGVYQINHPNLIKPDFFGGIWSITMYYQRLFWILWSWGKMMIWLMKSSVESSAPPRQVEVIRAAATWPRFVMWSDDAKFGTSSHGLPQPKKTLKDIDRFSQIW